MKQSPQLAKGSDTSPPLLYARTPIVTIRPVPAEDVNEPADEAAPASPSETADPAPPATPDDAMDTAVVTESEIDAEMTTPEKQEEGQNQQQASEVTAPAQDVEDSAAPVAAAAAGAAAAAAIAAPAGESDADLAPAPPAVDAVADEQTAVDQAADKVISAEDEDAGASAGEWWHGRSALRPWNNFRFRCALEYCFVL